MFGSAVYHCIMIESVPKHGLALNYTVLSFQPIRVCYPFLNSLSRSWRFLLSSRALRSLSNAFQSKLLPRVAAFSKIGSSLSIKEAIEVVEDPSAVVFESQDTLAIHLCKPLFKDASNIKRRLSPAGAAKTKQMAFRRDLIVRSSQGCPDDNRCDPNCRRSLCRTGDNIILGGRIDKKRGKSTANWKGSRKAVPQPMILYN
jgi:hypothetical protein